MVREPKKEDYIQFRKDSCEYILGKCEEFENNHFVFAGLANNLILLADAMEMPYERFADTMMETMLQYKKLTVRKDT